MGYLADTIAEARAAQPELPREALAGLWHMDTAAAWLAGTPPGFTGQRGAMVEALHAQLSDLAGVLGQAAIERALAAMAEVPRERFVCPWIDDLAYLPRSHDIGLDQVISPPALVAILAAAADPRGGKVLDVGTGSGYQAAVLARMARRVVSVEILEPLAGQAARRLAALGIDTVEIHAGDAVAMGLFKPESFDAIVVAAGADAVPAEFLAALRVGGRLVMPLGRSQAEERLTLVRRHSTGEFEHVDLRPARFVPLTGRGARK